MKIIKKQDSTTSTNHPNIQTRPANVIDFDPQKCVVLGCARQEDIRLLSHGNIRHTFGSKHGPLMIHNFRPCKFQSDTPKYMIQLANTKDVEKMCYELGCKLF